MDLDSFEMMPVEYGLAPLTQQGSMRTGCDDMFDGRFSVDASESFSILAEHVLLGATTRYLHKARCH